MYFHDGIAIRSEKMCDVTSCKQAMTLSQNTAIDFVAQSNCMIWEDFNYSAQDNGLLLWMFFGFTDNGPCCCHCITKLSFYVL